MHHVFFYNLNERRALDDYLNELNVFKRVILK